MNLMNATDDDDHSDVVRREPLLRYAVAVSTTAAGNDGITWPLFTTNCSAKAGPPQPLPLTKTSFSHPDQLQLLWSLSSAAALYLYFASSR